MTSLCLQSQYSPVERLATAMVSSCHCDNGLLCTQKAKQSISFISMLDPCRPYSYRSMRAVSTKAAIRLQGLLKGNKSSIPTGLRPQMKCSQCVIRQRWSAGKRERESDLVKCTKLNLSLCSVLPLFSDLQVEETCKKLTQDKISQFGEKHAT